MELHTLDLIRKFVLYKAILAVAGAFIPFSRDHLIFSFFLWMMNQEIVGDPTEIHHENIPI